jgi:hypothetical protein
MSLRLPDKNLPSTPKLDHNPQPPSITQPPHCDTTLKANLCEKTTPNPNLALQPQQPEDSTAHSQTNHNTEIHACVDRGHQQNRNCDSSTQLITLVVENRAPACCPPRTHEISTPTKTHHTHPTTVQGEPAGEHLPAQPPCYVPPTHDILIVLVTSALISFRTGGLSH